MDRDTWQLQEAKARLSELIDSSAKRGPQVVTRHGRVAAVVLSPADYGRPRRKRADFRSFLRRGALHGVALVRPSTTASRWSRETSQTSSRRAWPC